jgi:hypothetical protein
MSDHNWWGPDDSSGPHRYNETNETQRTLIMATKTKAQLVDENTALTGLVTQQQEQLIAAAILGGAITSLVIAVLNQF